jgi:hypothetical protein
MICRMYRSAYSLAPGARATVAWTGAPRRLFAATIGIAQTDIKKVLAYSTVSQLGFMFAAAGVAGYSAAVFHLMTHAFFKALLFLGAGSVILGMHHEQDIMRMGGLRTRMPWTWLTFLVGVIAICGVPPFSASSRRTRDPAGRARGQVQEPVDLARAPGDRRTHRVLHVPALLPGVHRRESRRPPHARSRARVAGLDRGAARGAGDLGDAGRLHRSARRVR